MISSDGVIAAIATPPGRGAIGVVRLSGKGSEEVLSRVFRPARKPGGWVSHRMEYGRIFHNGERIDEVMAVVMRSPRSYTKEDAAEIYAHGGMTSLRSILNAVIENGARPAAPGEFTQRAFLNGRINLTQAEAVADIINAGTDAARVAGLKLLGGGLSRKIYALRDTVLKWLASIELSIDYPEHETEAMNRELILAESGSLIKETENLLQTYKMGRVITDGISTAIIGKPNVGKSSLLNAILHEDRAIVTEMPGTTRDVLSETVQVHGIPLRLSDTAGIRDTDDAIEHEGVSKARRQAEDAALILFVADSSKPPDAEDLKILEDIKGKQAIIILNKSDIPRADGWENMNGISVSAKEQTGLSELYGAIRGVYMAGLDNSGGEAVIITRERHAWLLGKTAESLKAAEEALRNCVPEDLVSVYLRDAYGSLGEIVGEEVGDDVVDRIFSEFCVGK